MNNFTRRERFVKSKFNREKLRLKREPHNVQFTKILFLYLATILQHRNKHLQPNIFDGFQFIKLEGKIHAALSLYHIDLERILTTNSKLFTTFVIKFAIS